MIPLQLPISYVSFASWRMLSYMPQFMTLLKPVCHFVITYRWETEITARHMPVLVLEAGSNSIHVHNSVENVFVTPSHQRYHH
jgi:hypothetical protein